MAAAEINPRRLEQAISAAMRIRQTLLTDDDKLLTDTIDGETDAIALLDAIVEQALADEALVETARERIKRLEARADRRRGIVLAMLEALELHKVERPLFTASVSHRSKPLVSDPAVLPEAFIRRAPDMILLAKALRGGETIDGAVLSNPQPVLTIRKG